MADTDTGAPLNLWLTSDDPGELVQPKISLNAQKVNTAVANEIAARTQGDTNSVTAANTYTDQQIGIVGGAISTVSGAISTEATARANGDAATLSSARAIAVAMALALGS